MTTPLFYLLVIAQSPRSPILFSFSNDPKTKLNFIMFFFFLNETNFSVLKFSETSG